MKHILLLLLLLLLLSSSLWSADAPALNSNLEVVLADGTVVGDVVTATANTIQAHQDGVTPLVSLVEIKAAVRAHVDKLKEDNSKAVADLTTEKTKVETDLQAVVAAIEPAVALLAEAERDEGKSGRGKKLERLEQVRGQVELALGASKKKDKEKADVKNQIKALEDRLKTLNKD